MMILIQSDPPNSLLKLWKFYELKLISNWKVDLTLVSMVLVSKFSNFPDKLSKNDQLRGYELSRSDCNDNLGYYYDCCL